MAVRDPRAEAAARLGGRSDVRVLEPSPPAIVDAPWYADDPVAGGEVLPINRAASRPWSSVCAQRGDTALISFCVERWLGPWRRLESLPSSYGATKAGLHAVAENVLQPVRFATTGKIGLRWTLGGFGTPFLPGDRQVRVERGVLIDDDRTSELTTVADAAAFVGVTPGVPDGLYAPSGEADVDAPLRIDPLAAAGLGDWFGFCTSVLEQVRAEASVRDAPGRVQIWPEHFDIAVDLGDDAAGARCNVGGSPGDGDHAAPYLYVGPWVAQSGPFWNEPWGASLPYSALLDAPDQRQAALAFLRSGIARVARFA